MVPHGTLNMHRADDPISDGSRIFVESGFFVPILKFSIGGKPQKMFKK
jgi:hypothetical protein